MENKYNSNIFYLLECPDNCKICENETRCDICISTKYVKKDSNICECEGLYHFNKEKQRCVCNNNRKK